MKKNNSSSNYALEQYQQYNKKNNKITKITIKKKLTTATTMNPKTADYLGIC